MIKKIVQDVEVNSRDELLRHMDALANEILQMEQGVTTNMRLVISANTVPRNFERSFLQKWEKVFEMTGASIVWRRRGIWRWGDYVITIENTEPITARNFVKALSKQIV